MGGEKEREGEEGVTLKFFMNADCALEHTHTESVDVSGVILRAIRYFYPVMLR